ncbi:MAG: pyridoxal-phosphate dependent enzyme [Planctomycetota bacterium]
MTDDAFPTPGLGEFEAARTRLTGRIRTTPCHDSDASCWRDALGHDARVALKLELWQRTGSFKARGALLAALDLDAEGLRAGVTAVSAGNHALAVAFAAAEVGTTAKVVMPRTADPLRVTRCRELGAQVVLVADVHAAFAEAERIAREEGRRFLHPFESPAVVRGTGTIALEILEQVPDVQDVVVPIGGGGLCAGIAAAFARAAAHVRVHGVEPEGADSMTRSFAAGRPVAIDAVRTIADSLGSPRAEPITYALCRRHLHGLCRVSDAALRDAMRLLHRELKLAVEPACAASTAATLGPLAEPLRGRRVVLLLCGSNIDLHSISRLLTD